jgi:hypothetical protein
MLNSYTFRRQNYFVFQADRNPVTPSVHFLWGKFDFRAVLGCTEESEAMAQPDRGFRNKSGQYFVLKSLQNLYRAEWYEFVRPTAHGSQLEETLWQNNGTSHYAEYPQDLQDIACSICAAEMGLSPL